MATSRPQTPDLDQQAQALAGQINEFNKAQMKAGATPQPLEFDFDKGSLLKQEVQTVKDQLAATHLASNISDDVTKALEAHLRKQFDALRNGEFKKSDWDEGFAKEIKTQVDKADDPVLTDKIKSIQDKAISAQISLMQNSFDRQKGNQDLKSIEMRAEAAYGALFRQKMWTQLSQYDPSTMPGADASALAIVGAPPKTGPGLYKRPNSPYTVEEKADGTVIAHFTDDSRSRYRKGLEETVNGVAIMAQVVGTATGMTFALQALEYSIRALGWLKDATVNKYKTGTFDADPIKKGFFAADFTMDVFKSEKSQQLSSCREQFEFIAVKQGQSTVEYDFPGMDEDDFSKYAIDKIKVAIQAAADMQSEKRAGSKGPIVDLELGATAERLLRLTTLISPKEKEKIFQDLAKVRAGYNELSGATPQTPAATQAAEQTATATQAPQALGGIGAQPEQAQVELRDQEAVEEEDVEVEVQQEAKQEEDVEVEIRNEDDEEKDNDDEAGLDDVEIDVDNEEEQRPSGPRNG